VSEAAFDYDVAIIGSGFGGSVAALRLTEKGYRVGVLEAGRRFGPEDYAVRNWNLRRYLFFPKLGLRGIQRLSLLDDVLVLSGAGVGGGSLVYANTLYEPLPEFYADDQWRDITDWREELAPYYDQAKRMLGAARVPYLTAADEVVREVAERMGAGETFHQTEVAVYFGEPGVRVDDPYFGGEGPERVGCVNCGACMVGCRHRAKNSLDRNYLHLAERNGAEVHPEQQVTAVAPLPGGGYRVTMERSGSWLRKGRREMTAEQVVFAAGVLGTLKLLIRMKDEGALPHLSPRLGELVRTNSETLTSASTPKVTTDFSSGVAITSSFHPEPHTKIEPVRYPKGSNFMGLLSTVMIDGGLRRRLRFLGTLTRHPVRWLRSLWLYRWSERTIILLVMQSLDNSLRLRLKKGLFGRRLRSTQGAGDPIPSWIPSANESARHAADVIGGQPFNTYTEVLMNVPITAHILGGAYIGTTPEDGVVDPYQRLFGHEGLHVTDASAVTANLGANPSLTIAAQAERALAFWPNKGEADPRPKLGARYERIAPVAPRRPAVPQHAGGALRLPIARTGT
jgi:cholesterol oxidase